MSDDRTRHLPGTGVPHSDPYRTMPAPGHPRAPDAPPGAGVLPPAYVPHRPADGARPGAPLDDPAHAYPTGGRPGRGRRRRRWRWVVLLLVLVLVGYPVALGVVAWRSLGRVDALPDDTPSTPGRTYLVVGSDSRRGLSAAERRALRTGNADGQRTDTIMLLHVPAGAGPTVLMSVPRDSYVEIPGKGMNKINAAFALGGPKLLAQTLEQATGVQIDDYVEIGFGGFADMVEAVDGVQICPTFPMDDPKAGIKLKKGCQQARGAKALGYARARYSDPRGDFGRVERQREVLGAIVGKATEPTTVLNPLRAFPLASAGGTSLTVDENTGPVALARFVLGMRAAAGGDGISLTVPVSGTGARGGVGSVVLWDEGKSQQVFRALERSSTEPIRRVAADQAREKNRLTGR
ncbi:MAG: LCP family protein [Angustibacter sp.]